MTETKESAKEPVMGLVRRTLSVMLARTVQDFSGVYRAAHNTDPPPEVLYRPMVFDKALYAILEELASTNESELDQAKNDGIQEGYDRGYELGWESRNGEIEALRSELEQAKRHTEG